MDLNHASIGCSCGVECWWTGESLIRNDVEVNKLLEAVDVLSVNPGECVACVQQAKQTMEPGDRNVGVFCGLPRNFLGIFLVL